MIPFPVNEPELWPAYVPDGVTQYLRLFSDWGGEKLDRLRAAGYEVVILDEGAEKEVSGDGSPRGSAHGRRLGTARPGRRREGDSRPRSRANRLAIRLKRYPQPPPHGNRNEEIRTRVKRSCAETVPVSG